MYSVPPTVGYQLTTGPQTMRSIDYEPECPKSCALISLGSLTQFSQLARIDGMLANTTGMYETCMGHICRQPWQHHPAQGRTS